MFLWDEVGLLTRSVPSSDSAVHASWAYVICPMSRISFSDPSDDGDILCFLQDGVQHKSDFDPIN